MTVFIAKDLTAGLRRGRKGLRAACAILALWVTTAAVAQVSSDAVPPSIERVIIGETGRSEIEGEGRPGDAVKLVSDGAAIGEARVGANGRWRVVLKDGLKPGTYLIRADAQPDGAGQPAAGDEIRVAIPADLSGRAVIAYDGVTGEPERITRQRAEALAEAAGRAYDDVAAGARRAAPSVAPSVAPSGDAAPGRREDGPAADRSALSVVVEWLKRSARGYREDVVRKLGVAPPSPDAADTAEGDADPAAPSAAQAAREIAEARTAAEARRIDLAEADTVRKAKEAERSAADAAEREARKRKQAEDLARRKAESDKRIADELERLKRAKEEAERAKSRPGAAPNKANVTIERFYLPGDKPPASERPADRGRAAVAAVAEVTDEPGERPRAHGRCATGRVVHRKGRRWYVTGADDTLWDIAERFYGSGLAYPRIYRVNRKRLSSPHVVRPCLALRLPGRRG